MSPLQLGRWHAWPWQHPRLWPGPRNARWLLPLAYQPMGSPQVWSNGTPGWRAKQLSRRLATKTGRWQYGATTWWHQAAKPTNRSLHVLWRTEMKRSQTAWCWTCSVRICSLKAPILQLFFLIFVILNIYLFSFFSFLWAGWFDDIFTWISCSQVISCYKSKPVFIVYSKQGLLVNTAQKLFQLHEEKKKQRAAEYAPHSHQGKSHFHRDGFFWFSVF